jgi:hypothetical protein
VAGQTHTLATPGIGDIVILRVGASGLAWARTWGAPGDDDAPSAIAADPAGNIYVAGESTNQLGNTDMVILKLDASGSVIWSKRLDIDWTDSASDLNFDAAGNLIVVGSSSNDCTTTGCNSTALALKMSPAGDLLWAKSYDGPATLDYAGYVTVDASGNVVVLGVSLTTVRTIAGDTGPLFVLKMDTDGNLLWERDWGFPQGFNGTGGVTTDAAGNIYLGGSIGQGPALAKLTPSGDQVWALTENGINAYYGGVAIDANGRLFAAGLEFPNSGPPANFVDRFDTDGTLQERQTWALPANTEIAGVAMKLDPSGNAWVVGTAPRAAGSWVSSSPTLQAVGDLVGSSTFVTGTVAPAVSDPGLDTVPQTSGVVNTGGGGDDILLTGLALPPPGAPIGSECATAGDCQNGICVDGVCCQDACGNGADDDCQACSTAKGGTQDGTCTPVVAAHACTGPDFCDAPGSCSGNDTTCTASLLPPSMCTADSTDTVTDCGYSDPMYPVCVPLGGWLSGTPGSALIMADGSYDGRIKLVESSSGCAPPTGFQVPGAGNHYWDFTSDPDMSAPSGHSFKICFHYDQSWVSGIEDNLVIYHGTSSGSCDGTWTPLTGKVVDPTNNTICANTPSLSPFTIFVPDPATLPVVHVPADMTVSATSTSGDIVSFTATAADAQGTPLVPVCTPPSGSVFAVGTTAVTCTALDARQFTGSASFTVHVRYDAPTDGTFFSQPINPDGSSIFKAGSTIPVKFTLTGVSAGIKNLVAHISVARVSSGITGTYVEAASNVAGDAGGVFRYDATAGQYVYNLSTRGMATGTWSLRVDLGDAVNHTILVSLR